MRARLGIRIFSKVMAKLVIMSNSQMAVIMPAHPIPLTVFISYSTRYAMMTRPTSTSCARMGQIKYNSLITLNHTGGRSGLNNFKPKTKPKGLKQIKRVAKYEVFFCPVKGHYRSCSLNVLKVIIMICEGGNHNKSSI